MHSWLSNWGLVGSARDQILNYLQDLAKKKYIFQTFLPSCFNHHHTYGDHWRHVDHRCVTGLSMEVCWCKTPASNGGRSVGSPLGRLAGKKMEVFT